MSTETNWVWLTIRKRQSGFRSFMVSGNILLALRMRKRVTWLIDW